VRTRRAALALLVAALTGCGSTVQYAGTATQGTGVRDGLSPVTSATDTPGSGVSGPDAGVPTSSGGLPGNSGPTAGTVTAGPQATGSSGGSGAVPTKGPGWDAQTVSIGITTQQDVESVAQAAGVSSVDSGNQKADVEAVIAHYNSRGGLFGRKIKGQYFDIKSTGNPDTQAQAACSYFTQDHRVVAVYAAALVADTPTFRACLAGKHIPVLAGGAQAFDDQVFNELNGYYNLMPFPSWTRYAPAFVKRLSAQGFFSGWDKALGKPSATAPVKVGFVCPDTLVGKRVGKLINKELAKVGHPFSDEVYYTSDGDVPGYVLKFASDQVTHVIDCDLSLFVFATQAETQHYRPRYGISTFNTPVLFLQGVVPDAQLVGSLGSGFIPSLDVDDAHDPGPGVMPAAVACRTLAARSNVSYTPNRRFARAVLYDTCDIIGLIVTSAISAGSLDGPSIKRGIGIEGRRWVSATTFISGLSPTVHAMPSATRDIYYDTPCQCYRYRGGTSSMG
jgi:hypothetical protein